MNDLRKLLRANGVFSAASGLALVGGAPVANDALGLEAWLLAACGLILVGYGAGLWTAARASDPVPGGRLASLLDAGWVLGALVILIGFPSAMTPTGRLLLLVVSALVAGFAVLQIRTLRVDGAMA